MKLHSLSGTTLCAQECAVNPGSYILKTNTGGNERVILSMQTDNELISRKILTLRNSPGENVDPFINISGPAVPSILKIKSTTGFVYNPGDLLKFSAYSNSYHINSIQASPTSNSTFTFSMVSDSIFLCGDYLIDTRDGQSYATVQIGTQCWMAENLNIGTMVTSVNTGSSHSDVSNNSIIEKYCYGNDSTKCDIYGGLYDWDEAMGYSTTPGTQGICPDGWHIPSKYVDLDLLVTFLGNIDYVGGKLKETGTSHWNSPNTGANNITGFTALPGGSRESAGYFHLIGSIGGYWTSFISPGGAYYYSIWYNDAGFINYLQTSTMRGYSVRCIKD